MSRLMSRLMPRSLHRRWPLAAVLLAALLHLPAAALEEVPFVRTPTPVVDAILDLARVGPEDRLIDLGAGDGRIVITAAQRFGTRGLGVEIDPSLVTLARSEAAAAGVAHLVRFETQDLFDTELGDATVVTLYLLPDVNLALRPKLLAQLAPGSRVVSHDWDMGDWAPDRSITVPAPGKPVGLRQESRLLLWVIPAQVDGDWRLEIAADDGPAQTLPLQLRQHFQTLQLTAAQAQGSGRLSGRSIRFTLAQHDKLLRFEGEADAQGMRGRVDDGQRVRSWSAQRLRAPAPSEPAAVTR